MVEEIFVDFVATGSAGNRTLTTNILGGVTNLWTQTVGIYGGSGFTLGQCNTEAKRLIKNWNNTKFWTVLVDTSSDFGGSPHNCLRLWKPAAKEPDKFLNSDGRLNGKLVTNQTGSRIYYYQQRRREQRSIYLNDLMNHKQPFGPTSRLK